MEDSEFYKIQKLEFPTNVEAAIKELDLKIGAFIKHQAESRGSKEDEKKHFLKDSTLNIKLVKDIVFNMKRDGHGKKIAILSPINDLKLTEILFTYFEFLKSRFDFSKYMESSDSKKLAQKKTTCSILDQASTFFNNLKNKSDKIKQRQIVFDVLFGRKGRDEYHVKILSQVLIISITVNYAPILFYFSHWLQKNLLDHMTLQTVSQKLIEDFYIFKIQDCYFFPLLPQTCPVFGSYFVNQIIFLCYFNFCTYYISDKINILVCITKQLNDWLEKSPIILLQQIISGVANIPDYKMNQANLFKHNNFLILICWFFKYGFSMNAKLHHEISKMFHNFINILSQAPQYISDIKIRRHLLLNNFNNIEYNPRPNEPYALSLFGCMEAISQIFNQNHDKYDHQMDPISILEKYLLIILIAQKNGCLPKTIKREKVKVSENFTAQSEFPLPLEPSLANLNVNEKMDLKPENLDPYPPPPPLDTPFSPQSPTEEGAYLEEGEERSPPAQTKTSPSISFNTPKIKEEQLISSQIMDKSFDSDCKVVSQCSTPNYESPAHTKPKRNFRQEKRKLAASQENSSANLNKHSRAEEETFEEINWLEAFNECYIKNNLPTDDKLYKILNMYT